MPWASAVKDAAMHAYGLLGVLSAEDGEPLFPVKPKLHEPWKTGLSGLTVGCGGGGGVKSQGLGFRAYIGSCNS